MRKLILSLLVLFTATSCVDHNLNINVKESEDGDGVNGTINLKTNENGEENLLNSIFTCKSVVTDNSPDQEDQGTTLFDFKSSGGQNGEAGATIIVDGETLECSANWNSQE